MIPWRFITWEAEGVRVHVERRVAEAVAGPLRIGCVRLGPAGRVRVRGLPRLGAVSGPPGGRLGSGSGGSGTAD